MHRALQRLESFQRVEGRRSRYHCCRVKDQVGVNSWPISVSSDLAERRAQAMPASSSGRSKLRSGRPEHLHGRGTDLAGEGLRGSQWCATSRGKQLGQQAAPSSQKLTIWLRLTPLVRRALQAGRSVAVSLGKLLPSAVAAGVRGGGVGSARRTVGPSGVENADGSGPRTGSRLWRASARAAALGGNVFCKPG